MNLKKFLAVLLTALFWIPAQAQTVSVRTSLGDAIRVDAADLNTNLKTGYIPIDLSSAKVIVSSGYSHDRDAELCQALSAGRVRPPGAAPHARRREQLRPVSRYRR